MPTSQVYKQRPELIKARDEIKSYMLRVIGKCEVTSKRGNLDLHEGLVPAAFTMKMKPENAKIVLAHICLSPANVFLIDHDTHTNAKPAIEKFYEIAFKRNCQFYRGFPVEFKYKDYFDAFIQFYTAFDLFKAYGIIKNIPIKPANYMAVGLDYKE